MYREENCKCGKTHECAKCLPLDIAVQLARSIDLPFVLVMLHKGHYCRDITTGNLWGADPQTVQLWHALVELDSQHF